MSVPGGYSRRRKGQWDMESKCGAVILAGGRGSRFGGANKAELLHLGKSFRCRIEEELDELGLPCFFSAGEYPPPEQDGLKVIRDLPVEGEKGTIGPMGGMLSCFEQTQCGLLFFVSCDMPLFHGQLARRLLEKWTPGTDALVWRTRSGRLQPLCGLYARSCLPALRECVRGGDYRLMRFLEKISCTVVETSAEQIPDFWFCNVNCREAYLALGGFKPPVLAVSGTKNTGKTTLLERMVAALTHRGMRVAVIKHDGHDFEADVPGTDSRRMQEAGAYGTVVYSDKRYLAVKRESGRSAADFLPLFPEADLVLLEGQKYSSYPKLELVRRAAGAGPVCPRETVLAYVTDLRDRAGRPAVDGAAVPVFGFDELERITAFTVDFMDGQARRGGLEL